MSEEWRPVPGAEGALEASTAGRVRRIYKNAAPRIVGARRGSGYVICYENGHQVFRHVLVARTFHGEQPEPGMQVRHLNGVPGDDRPENLRWGTPKENAQDSIRHGTNYALTKRRCKWGHAFTEANTFIDNLGRRICRTCKARNTTRQVRRIAEARRLQRVASWKARPDRGDVTLLPDGSVLVSYRNPMRYFREWESTGKRERLTSKDYRASLIYAGDMAA